MRLLDATGALYLDTQESRGLVPQEHPSVVGAARAAAMTDADVVLLVGRKLDYQMDTGRLPLPASAFHSNFGLLRRVDRQPARSAGNSRGTGVSARCNGEDRREPSTKRRCQMGGWPTQAASRTHGRDGHSEKGNGWSGRKIHPRAIFDVIAEVADKDYIAIADGGDLLSFARVGLAARTYMDAGAFGCLGVGVPFAIAAALAFPDRQVISVNGDGAYGINAMEIDTAVRHGARAVFIVSNNAAWNINVSTRK